MKKHYRPLALLVSCAIACAAPMSALCTEAVQAGETAAASEEEPAEVLAAPEEEPAEVITEEIMEEAVEETSNGYVTPEEAVPAAEGYCGEELTWEYAEGILGIKGTGAMYDYSEEIRPEWAVYAEEIREIRIGKGVTLLDGDAFEGLTALEGISYEGSEEEWEALGYAGTKEKKEVFESVTEYYFEEEPAAEEEPVEEPEAEEEEPEAVEEETVDGESKESAEAVSEPLSIISEPQDVTAAAGERITFQVEANKEEVYYQWQWSADGKTWKDCSAAGHDTDTFGFAMKASYAGRYYRCLVFDDSDEILSRAARITLETEEALEITEQPADAEASAGETVSFHVSVNKTGVTYQWQWSKDGTTWRNCTSEGYDTATFGFAMKDTLDGRQYRCIVTAGNEQVTTRGAVISRRAEEALEITEQPADVEASAGETVILHVSANKEATYQWQWSKDGTTWRNCTSAGYNTDTFSFTMKDTLDGRQYRCIVTAGSEQVPSEGAVISRKAEEALRITKQPADVEAGAGETVILHVEANKEATYQWQYSTNGTTWKNCTSGGCKTDTFSFAMKESVDGRQYRCIVTAGSEQVPSDGAVITYKSPLTLTEQPEDVEAEAGERVTLHVEANKTGVTYQWQYSTNGTTWKNCTSGGYSTDTFSFTMKETLNGRQYRCIVKLGTESVTSESALITYVDPAIVIDGVVYELIDEVMTVTGYRGSADTVVVEETVDGHTVTVIGESAFEGSAIRTIDLPETIQVIKRRAFANCSNLMNME